MSRRPTVSVIIAAYKAPEYLNQAIESVAAQTFNDYEIIVVDDGSGEEYTSQYRLPENATLICHPHNVGAVAATRNTGIRVSRGKYLAFLDQDDIWVPEKLAVQVKAFEDNPGAGLVYSHYKAVDERLNPVGGETKRRSSLRDPLKKLSRGCIIRSPSCVMIPRRVIDECGMFDESIPGASDWELYWRIASRYSFVVSPDQLTLYRMHSDQLHKRKPYMHAAKLLMMDKALKWSQSERPDMLKCVRHNYGRVLRQLAIAKLEDDPAGAVEIMRHSIAMWPYNIRHYLYLARIIHVYRKKNRTPSNQTAG
ncbi:MAG: glycosyltransferase family 2 protein [Armatimonadota bacterium]